MICKKCGTDNPDYYIFCQNCFSDLSEEDASSPSEKEATPTSSAPPPNDEPKKKNVPKQTSTPSNDETIVQQRPRSARPTRENYTSATNHEENDVIRQDSQSIDMSTNQNKKRMVEKTPPKRVRNTSPKKEIRDSAYDQPANAQKQANNAEAARARKANRDAEKEARELKKLEENSGAEYYDYYDYYDETALKHEKKRSNILTILFWAVLVAIIAVAGFFGYKFLTGGLGSKKEITVEQTYTPDGSPAHTITIPMKSGETVKFLEESMGSADTVATSNNLQPFQIPDSAMIPTNPSATEATISVKPQMALVDKNGVENIIEFAPYTINVPQVQLVIAQPQPTDNIIATSSSIEIIGQAYADGKAVQLLVNNELQTVDPTTGSFSVKVPVTAGAFSIDVTAMAAQYRANTIVITGTMQPAPGANNTTSIATFNEDYANKRISDASMTISGTTQPNTTLTVPGARDLQYDSTTGVFSFIAPMLTIGQHQFTMTLGDNTSEVLTLTKVPDVTNFWAGATQLNYSDVLANPDSSLRKSVWFDGIIGAVDSSLNPPTYIVSVQGNSEQKVRVQYFGVRKFAPGDSVTVYGDISNVDKTTAISITMEGYFFYDSATMQSVRSGSIPSSASAETTPSASVD